MKTILLLLLILLSIHSTAQVPNYVPTTGLVGYWPFSGNANDVSGNGNNGAVNGAILSTDRFGNANSSYSFNGVNCCGTPDATQEINVNNQFINLGQDYTVSCWMKSIDVSKYQQLLFLAGSAVELNNEHVPTKLSYAVGPGTSWDLLYAQGTFTNFQNNIWYHVVFVKSNTTYTLYLNSSFEGSSVVANSVNYSQTSSLIIGSLGSGHEVFKGSLDDFAVWNRALTPTEITGIYNSTPIPPTLSIAATPSTASCPGTPVTLTANTTSGASACTATSLPSNLQTGLVGYWPFCGNASDASGNGNNGTVNGATLTADRYGNPNSAYSFIGSNQIVVSPNFYDNGWSSSTISIWFNTSSLSQQHQALFNTIPHDGEAIVWNHSAAPNKICHWKNENTSVGSWNIFAPNALNYNNVQENNWINISIVKNNMQYSYYVNGILDKVSISSIAALNQLSAIRFGSIGTTEFFNGKLDDIAIWNRALTSAEVQQLYTLNNDSPTYSWSPGGATSPSITVSPTSTTTYSCTITANSLSTTSSTSVTVLPAPTITATYASICEGASTTLTAAAGSTSTPNTCANLSGSLATGLVGYWPFCGNANDASGNSNNGTVNGATLTTDRYGNANSAYSFDGVNQFIDLGSLTSIGSNPSIVSYNFWMKTSDIPTPNIAYPVFSKRHQQGFGYDWCTARIEPDNKLKFFKDDDFYVGNSAMTTTLNLNEWNHFVLVKNGNDLSLYQNGILISTVTDTYLLSGSPGNFYIGLQGAWNYYFKGQIDDFGIWNRTLTTTEIQQLYMQGQTTYAWSPGGATTPSITVSPTSTTTYTCTVTDANGSCSSSQTITVNPLPNVNAGPDQTICSGTSAILTATGASTYSWTGAVQNGTAFTPANSGAYTVTGTSNGCSATDEVSINVSSTPTITATNASICEGASTTLTAATVAGTSNPCPTFNGSLALGIVESYSFCGNPNNMINNSNNGVVSGATLTTDALGNPNSAFSFNGTSDYISIPNDFLNGQPSSSTSFRIRFLKNSNGNFCLWNKDGSWLETSIYITNDNKLGLFWAYPNYYSGIETTSNTILNNIWYDVVIVVANNSGQIYLNNILQTNVTSSITNSTIGFSSSGTCGTGINRFGFQKTSCIPTSFFNGKLDEFQIYNRQLSLLEIQQLYTQGQTTYAWSPGGATTPSITVSPTSTTTYTCTVTDANGSCSSSQTITVNPLPNVNAGPDQTICSGTSAILTATGASTYSWTGAVQNGTAFTPANSGAYTVTGTSNGCSATDEVSINVSSTPTITATNTSICEGASTTLTAAAGSTSTPNTCANLSGSLATGLVGYWPFCGNANDASGNSNNGTVNGATLTTDRFGNANSAYSLNNLNDLITISNVNPALSNFEKTISTWIKLPSQFNYSSLALVKHGTAYSTGFDVAIDQNNVAYGNNNYAVVFLAGTASISFLSNQSELGSWCNLVSTYNGSEIKIYLNGILKASQLYSGSLNCNNGVVYFGLWDNPSAPNFTARQLDDIGIWNRALTTTEIQQLYTQGQTTYAWSPGGATTPSITVSPTSTTTYTCTVTDANGSCSSSQTITVNPLPNVNAGPDQTICSGTSAILTATGASTYSWTGGVQNGTAFTPANSGAYTVTGTSAAGCSSQDDVLVTVNPLPSATVTVNGATSFCSGGNTQLCAPIGTGLSYTWSGNLGTTSCINISSTQTTSVTVTNAQGCSATSLPQQVVVFSNPVANVGPDATITCNQNASGTQIGANPNPLYTYSWSPTIGLSSATSANPIANPSSTTTYTLSVINADGCTGSNQVTVTVNNTPPISNAGLDFTKTCISNVSGSSIGATSVVGNTYSWTPTSGLSSATVANPTANPTLTTTYTLTTTNTASGCSTTDQVTVNVNNTAPTINPIPNYSFCANESSNNILFSGTANSSFAWTNSNSNIGLSPSGNGNITSFLTQNNSNMTIVSLITVTPTLSNGCVGAPQTFSITVNPLPIVSPVNNQTVCCQGATAPISLISNLPGTLSWTSIANSPLLSSFPNSGNGNIPSFLPVNNSLTDQSILFLLTPISTQGCIGSIESVTVTVLPCNIFVDQVNNLEFCNPSNFVGITFTGNATSFLWTNNFTDSGIPTSGMDNIPSMTLTNATQQNIMSHIITTPIYESNGLTCTGNGIDFFINVYPTPMVNAGSDQTICTGANITLNGSGAHSYVWNNGVIDGISFLPISTNSYTVIGTDVNGCTNSDVVLITVGSPTSSSISASSCDTYTLNNQTYSQSGIFEQIIPNTSGCDSTITLNLNMDFSPITPVITLTNGVTMTTPTQANVTYQWINCSNLTPIAGATGATFTASMNGVYAVVASNACGSDTSACSTVNSVGLETLSSNGVSVFPNPTNELLTVQVPVDFIGCQWNLVDIRGRHVLNGRVDIEQFQLNLSDLARGTYWISLGTNQPIQVVKN